MTSLIFLLNPHFSADFYPKWLKKHHDLLLRSRAAAGMVCILSGKPAEYRLIKVYLLLITVESW